MAYEWIVNGLDEAWSRMDSLMRPRPAVDYDTRDGAARLERA